jgi:hypothetical protein
MQIADENSSNALRSTTPASHVSAEIWLAATVIIAAMTVVGLGALSYIY